MSTDYATAIDAAWDAIGNACKCLLQDAGHHTPEGRDAYALKILYVVDTIDEDDPISAVGLRWSARWGCRPSAYFLIFSEKGNCVFLSPSFLPTLEEWIERARESAIGFWIPPGWIVDTNNSNVIMNHDIVRFHSYREAFRWLGERVIETGANSWNPSPHS
jgi:hypothetical protein